MCLMCSQLTPQFPVLAVSIKIFTKISIMRVRSVEGNCYFLIKRVGTYYGNAQATHPVKQIASKSGKKFHQMSFIFLQLRARQENNTPDKLSTPL